MRPDECPNCGSIDFEYLKFEDIHKCKNCGNRFAKCSRCGSLKTRPVEPFDYVKECQDCGHQFSGGEHN